jgi:hypothetical protein
VITTADRHVGLVNDLDTPSDASLLKITFPSILLRTPVAIQDSLHRDLLVTLLHKYIQYHHAFIRVYTHDPSTRLAFLISSYGRHRMAPVLLNSSD